MTKAQLSAALVLVALFGLPLAAQASVVHTPVASKLVSEDDNGGDDNGQHRGDDNSSVVDPNNPSDKDDTFVVPPVVIHPGAKGPVHHFKPGTKPPVNKQPTSTVPDVAGDHPIRLDQVKPSAKTPTDAFVDTAVIGLGAVGAGALGLGVVVGVRTIRARRNGEKADYFYGS